MTEIDLIDWTIQEAQHLKDGRREPSDLDDGPSLEKILTVLEREPAGPTKPEDPVAQIASAPSIQMAIEEPIGRPPSQAVAAPNTDDVSDLPPAAPAASSISAEALTEEPKSALLMAIVAPDIYTAQVDRDRAIALRWVLRDIKNNRLKWWPVNQHDLRDLIDMELVEMRNDAPVLTNAGVNAII
jgi:hypothetical protein